MRLNCHCGYYKFYLDYSHELDLLKAQGFDLVQVKDYFTFKELATLPSYSIEKLPYFNINATKTYAGAPADILEANNFVYDYANKQIVTAESITGSLEFALMDYYAFYLLPQCGGLVNNKKIKSFNGFWDIGSSQIISIKEINFYE